MTISTTYEIEIHYILPLGNIPITVDFTDRCTGFYIKQMSPVGRFGSGMAQIELRNDDGELTPEGSGAYADIDWFKASLWINAEVTGDSTSTAYLFQGIVADIQFKDDGRTSTVQIEARDAFSVGGRAPVNADISIPAGTHTFTSGSEAVEAIYNGFTSGGTEYIPQTVMPNLGNATEVFMVTASSAASETPQVLDNLVSKAPADIVNNYVMPSMPGAAWPTQIQIVGGAGPSLYVAYMLENDLTKNTGTGVSDRRTFVFADNAGAGELPFKRVSRQFNVGALTNSAQLVRSVVGATEQQSQDTESIEKYGARNRRFTTTNQNDTDTLDAAYRWSHRFSQSRFTPVTVELTDRMAELMAGADDQIWQDLIDVRTGMWSVATVEYTPTGETSPITDVCVIVGRTFRATPSHTTLTLDLLPAADYQSFVLNSDTIGVLDTNRLG